VEHSSDRCVFLLSWLLQVDDGDGSVLITSREQVVLDGVIVETSDGSFSVSLDGVDQGGVFLEGQLGGGGYLGDVVYEDLTGSVGDEGSLILFVTVQATQKSVSDGEIRDTNVVGKVKDLELLVLTDGVDVFSDGIVMDAHDSLFVVLVGGQVLRN
jgi:hypothetical protein